MLVIRKKGRTVIRVSESLKSDKGRRFGVCVKEKSVKEGKRFGGDKKRQRVEKPLFFYTMLVTHIAHCFFVHPWMGELLLYLHERRQ